MVESSSAEGRVKRLLVLGAGPAQLGLLEAARARGLHVIAADLNPGAIGFRKTREKDVVLAYGLELKRVLEASGKVDVVISNHLFRDGGDVKMAQLEKRVPGEAHTYVLGQARALKLFTVLSECAAAKLLHTPSAPTN